MNCLRFAAKIYPVKESELLKPIGTTKRFIRLQSNEPNGGDKLNQPNKYVNKCTIIQNKKTGVPPRPKSIYSQNNGVKSNGAAPVYESIYNVPYSCHQNYDIIYSNTINNKQPVHNKRETNLNDAVLKKTNESNVIKSQNRVSKRESDLLNGWRPRLNQKPPLFDKTISTDTTIYNVPLNVSKYKLNYSNLPRMSQIKTYQSRINRKVEHKPIPPPVYMPPPAPPQQQQFYYYFSNINYSYFNAI